MSKESVIVEDVPQTRQELVELLAAEKGIEVVGQAGSVSDALAGIEAEPEALTSTFRCLTAAGSKCSSK